jgi:hypothetical protein
MRSADNAKLPASNQIAPCGPSQTISSAPSGAAVTIATLPAPS